MTPGSLDGFQQATETLLGILDGRGKKQVEASCVVSPNERKKSTRLDYWPDARQGVRRGRSAEPKGFH